MRLAYALVADHAEAINGKLYVHGGLVARVAKPGFPTSLGLSLAVVLEHSLEEVGTNHDLAVTFAHAEDPEPSPYLQAQLSVGEPGDESFAVFPVPLAVPLQFPVDRPGPYEIHITLDGDTEITLHLDVVGPPTAD
jgi:Family of unknown function (DUF6941)